MYLDVLFNPAGLTEADVRDKAVIVLEVLRTSTSMVTALHNGAKTIVPAPTLGDAARMAANLDPKVFVLGGEKNGQPISGYQLGNSPLEYTPEAVANRTVIMHTSNLTNAISIARSAPVLVVGCFLNMTRLINFVAQSKHDILVVCGGHKGTAALGDVLCVGQMVELLTNVHKVDAGLSDAAMIAHSTYLYNKNHVVDKLKAGVQGKALEAVGLLGDVPYSCQIDFSGILPVFNPSNLSINAS
ncbi:MAG TPA: hypothetical protein DIW24_07285 [Bacteroidetes bacterium]|nr:hypothetical protein [Bacteroidota bacterium]HRR08596.1 2-phosphosulfolactate phosphatase [Rhodothermales bacterium]